MSLDARFKPNLLAIVPPYAVYGPPAGAAALLGYLKASGCHDFGFLDLRLFAPDVATPTYRVMGTFGESFVLDVPDLPLVLALLDNVARGRDLVDIPAEVLERHCVAHGINSLYLRSYLERMDHLTRAVFDQLPDLEFVGFSVWTSNYLTTLLAAAHLKRRRRPPYIVAGGPQVSQSPASAQLALRSGVFDAVAVGEGEQTLVDLYGRYSRGRGAVTGPVAGTITYDPSTGAFPSTERSLLRLKELPLPDFDQMHLPAYRIGGKRVLTYQLSRGCTDKCSFCSEWVFWRHFRLGNMDKAVSDVAELQRRFGAERIWFTDSLLNGQMSRLTDFAQGLVDHGVEIQWSGYMRAQMNAPTAALLRRAGCIRVFVGVESLADETLELMNKRMTETQNLAAVRTFLDAGIAVKLGLIPGFPGDTRERFVRTAAVLRQLQATTNLLAVSHEAFVVLPGQPIYNDLGTYGLRKIPWGDDVLRLCPELADIARQVGCRIEGANQGLDRLGEYAISMSIIGPAHPTDRESDETHEALSLYRLEQTYAAGGVWLVRTLSPGGHIVGAIVTDEERGWFQAGRERAAAAGMVVTAETPQPICETPEIAGWLAEILSRHAVHIPVSGPRVTPVRYRRLAPEIAGTLRVALGPFTIVRRIGETLWLADLATGEVRRLPADDEAAAALLGEPEPAARAGIVALTEAGFLVYESLPEDPAEDPAEAPAIVEAPPARPSPSSPSSSEGRHRLPVVPL